MTRFTLRAPVKAVLTGAVGVSGDTEIHKRFGLTQTANIAMSGTVTASGNIQITEAGGDSEATTNQKYVRADATGSGSGDDWTNAYTNLPATLTRDTTYWVADGSYGGQTLDDALDGTKVIRIKKATASLHGTETGWVSTYGDGVATFASRITLNRGYYIIDGSTRAANWATSSAYGFRINQLYASSLDGDAAHFSTVKYASVGESDSPTFTSGLGPAANFVYNQHDLTLAYCSFHNSTGAIIQAAGTYNFTIEYCWFGPSWSKEAIRGGNGSPGHDWIIRHCTFWNACQIDPDDGTSGITAEIGIWDSATTGSLDNIEVYGCIFYNQYSGGRNAAIVIGGDGGASWAGVASSGSKVYNCTFAGFPEAGSDGVVKINGTDGIVRNSLFYDTAGVAINATTKSNNIDAATDPFVNYAGLDFHIVAASDADGAGIDIGTAPYDTDRDGVSREGNWSVGAYEVA